MNVVYKRLKAFYSAKGHIMPIEQFREEFSSKHVKTDQLVDGVFEFNKYLNAERVEELELMNSVNVRRQVLIDRLISTGINQSSDHRLFQELTLTELEHEWQMFEEFNGVSGA